MYLTENGNPTELIHRNQYYDESAPEHQISPEELDIGVYIARLRLDGEGQGLFKHVPNHEYSGDFRVIIEHIKPIVAKAFWIPDSGQVTLRLATLEEEPKGKASKHALDDRGIFFKRSYLWPLSDPRVTWPNEEFGYFPKSKN